MCGFSNSLKLSTHHGSLEHQAAARLKVKAQAGACISASDPPLVVHLHSCVAPVGAQ